MTSTQTPQTAQTPALPSDGHDDGLLVSAVQAAQLSNVSERTIRRWIAQGKLPAHHIAPNRFAIRLPDIVSCNPGRNTLAAHMAVLHARITWLEARIAALEGLRDVSAVPGPACAREI